MAADEQEGVGVTDSTWEAADADVREGRLEDDLVICTRNRPAELRGCLESVAAQRRRPRHVLIVDGSDGDGTRHLVDELNAAAVFAEPLAYVRTAPGTARARNLGVSLTSSPVVHFVDDDVRLDPGYFAGLMEVFERDTAGEIGGAGGVIVDMVARSPNWVERRLQLDGVRPGAVLSSGRNVLVYSTDRELEVDWLSGCSMSFRREPLEEELFDPRLEGYSLGEDIDTSYRIAQRYRLVITPSARQEHFLSPVGRLDSRSRSRMELVNRYRRVRARTGRLRPWAFWWSAFGQLGYFAGLAVVKLSRHWALEALTTLGAIVAILAGRAREIPYALLRQPGRDRASAPSGSAPGPGRTNEAA